MMQSSKFLPPKIAEKVNKMALTHTYITLDKLIEMQFYGRMTKRLEALCIMVETAKHFLTPSVKITIKIYATSFKKTLKPDEKITSNTVNSGYFIPFTKTIIIFRNEEIEKVLLHELLHAHKYELPELSDQEQVVLQAHFGSKEKILLNEAYIDALAIYHHTRIYFPTNFKAVWNNEIKYAKEKREEVIAHNSFQNTDTNVIAYYIIKPTIMEKDLFRGKPSISAILEEVLKIKINNKSPKKQSPISMKMTASTPHIYKVLEYGSNSCYFDAFIVAMFHFIHPKMSSKKYFICLLTRCTKAKVSIDMIHEFLDVSQGKKNVSKLRRMFQNLDDYDDDRNWLEDQLEPFDIILILERLFEFPLDIEFTTDNLTNGESPIVRKASFAGFIISAWEYDNVVFSSTMVSGHIESKITKADMLWVHVTRTSGTSKTNNVIIPSATIQVGNKELELVSVVCHHGSVGGGHYITYFKKKSKWYCFDDMDLSSKEVYTVEDNQDIYRNCTDFVYI